MGFLASLEGVLLSCTNNCHPNSKGIITQSKKWNNKNHAFITQALEGTYFAEFVLAKDLFGKERATTKEVLERTNAKVCFNGSFFEKDSSPSGFYVHKGTLLHEYVSGKGDGILYLNRKNTLSVVPFSEFSKIKSEVVSALQLNLLRYKSVPNYPFLPDSPCLPRNFIGFFEECLVNVIFKNTNFTKGDIYMKESHSCFTVAALDGGPSASAFDSSGKSSFKEGDVSEVPVPNFIVLYER